jgi:hypothetical protein
VVSLALLIIAEASCLNTAFGKFGDKELLVVVSASSCYSADKSISDPVSCVEELPDCD